LKLSVVGYQNWVHRSPTWQRWEGNWAPIAAVVSLPVTGALLRRVLAAMQLGGFATAVAEWVLGFLGLMIFWPLIAIGIYLVGRLTAGVVDRIRTRGGEPGAPHGLD